MEERKCCYTSVHVVVGPQSRKYDSVPESVFKYLSVLTTRFSLIW